ncbi:phage tail protein [Clostridium aminobutyricum]|uniref:Tail fiber protein n=1 Tax=Clostridium aminobutyricum TaxID=33953 RepID=A0A939D8U8_CLOAM|nr:phage tail protein [Clostridium aminobutyricum]MBN7773271.1 tail fiber protein [Clostridium aminobutyricum]
MDIDYYVGGIVLFPYSFNLSGWLPCEGQEIQIIQYQALYTLIGTKFGGNGSTTFKLPNLTGAEPISGMRYYIAMTGIFPSRQ